MESAAELFCPFSRSRGEPTKFHGCRNRGQKEREWHRGFSGTSLLGTSLGASQYAISSTVIRRLKSSKSCQVLLCQIFDNQIKNCKGKWQEKHVSVETAERITGKGIESCCHSILAFCSFTVTDRDGEKNQKIWKKTFLFSGDFVRSMNHICESWCYPDTDYL